MVEEEHGLKVRSPTPQEELYIETYLKPIWRRKEILEKLRRQLDEFFESSAKEWNVEFSKPMDTWTVLKSLYHRIQKRWIGKETEIRVVNGKTVIVRKL